MLKLSFVCLDTETTGLNTTSEIIEVGMVKVIDGRIADRYSQLVRPLLPIPEQVTLLTSIDNRMVEDQPTWRQIEQQVLDFIGDFTLVAHNVPFDRGMLEQHLGRILPNPWVDTHDMAKIFLPSLTSYKLISIAGALDVERSDFHRALADADCAAQVLLKLAETACALDPRVLQEIAQIFQGEPCGLTTLLQAILQEAVSRAEIGKVYADVTPAHTYGKQPRLRFEESSRFFEPDGLMAQATASYQHRPQQLEMQEAVSRAFSEERHGIIEAGTGTGKSFAYLVPALLWAYEHDCRVLVSTNTIALQEQLYNKDIPFIKECIDFDFPVALSKGRGNYICLRRFEQYRRQASGVTWNEKIFIAQLVYWLSYTEHGDKETLNFNKLEQQFWASVSSQSETCLGNQCGFVRNCYFMRSRRECENSMLIITNHALLLQNIKLDNMLLPSCEHIIIDEAHNLEEEATRQFTDTVDLEFLRKNGQYLLRSNSVLSRILAQMKDLYPDGDTYRELLQEQQSLREDVEVLEQQIRATVDYIFTVGQLAGTNELRITAKERQSGWWQDFSELLSRLRDLVGAVYRRLVLIEHRAELTENTEQLCKELVFQQNWFVEQAGFLGTFLQQSREGDIYWIEYSHNGWGSNLCLSVAPIDVMPLLKERLFDANDSVILTSATLAVANDLRYTARLYLLEEDAYVGYITPSPFDYETQSCIAIPTDIADYSRVSEDTYAAMLVTSLSKILQSVTGGVLVLFTSYAMLNRTYFALKQDPALRGYNILAHGQDGNRTSILQSLHNTENTVVLGASSFWEGVDVKGTGLTTLVITKLPFQPPTRPIVSAKMEYVQAQGKNSFSDYSLPQAVLKFRQGCGRLIRSADDWGAIIVLDKRVLSKGYGKDFLNSLPRQPILRKPLNELCRTLHDWMQEKASPRER